MIPQSTSCIIVLMVLYLIQFSHQTVLTDDQKDQLDKRTTENWNNNKAFYDGYQEIPAADDLCLESKNKHKDINETKSSQALRFAELFNWEINDKTVKFYVLLYDENRPQPPQLGDGGYNTYYENIRAEVKRNEVYFKRDGTVQGSATVIDSLAASDAPIYLLVHGWTDSIRSLHMINGVEWMYIVGDDWRYYDKGNVILVDWNEHALKHYVISKLFGMGDVANTMLEILTKIFNLKFNNNDNQIRNIEVKRKKFYATVKATGHSLGGQLLGYLGYLVQWKFKCSIGTLYILDPAGPFFTSQYLPGFFRINKKYANRVLVLHTELVKLGLTHAVGHVDYYGFVASSKEDWCDSADSISSCKHQRATNLFRASLVPPDDGNFRNYAKLLVGFKCNVNHGERVGNQATSIFGIYHEQGPQDEGVYYLPISSCKPYHVINGKRELSMKTCKIREENTAFGDRVFAKPWTVARSHIPDFIDEEQPKLVRTVSIVSETNRNIVSTPIGDDFELVEVGTQSTPSH